MDYVGRLRWPKLVWGLNARLVHAVTLHGSKHLHVYSALDTDALNLFILFINRTYMVCIHLLRLLDSCPLTRCLSNLLRQASSRMPFCIPISVV